MHHSVKTHARHGFTLIELLTVVAIISLLISILMPSLTRARDQAKGVHCAARLHDVGIALATYENVNGDLLPPCEWQPDPQDDDLHYGWVELLYADIWKEAVYDDEASERGSFPVQRNDRPTDWQEYFTCKASPFRGVHSGHYRTYLPGWLMGNYTLDADRRYDIDTVLNPRLAGARELIAPRMPLIGDGNEQSERGDGDGLDESSFIDAGEANTGGSLGFNGNRFSDRHYGGTNYLFQDFHAAWKRNNFRARLARDFDLNGVDDVDVEP
ncbi:MAG: type II secretion system protein [Planctomycetes bacterium]|nr:type II secretion system protein [Planctomycetota bacterium]